MQPLAPGTLLRDGSYCLEAAVGKGGLGLTYRALTAQGEVVAVKEFAPPQCRRENRMVVPSDEAAARHLAHALARLQEQVPALSSLRHPHVVSVREGWIENGTHYLALDWLEGITLQCQLDTGGAWSQQDALELIRAVAGGAAHMHRKGLLHLDTKPENIMLSGRGPVLIDFDLVQPVGSPPFGTRPLHLSLPCGTPGYAALEQYAQQAPLTPATDVYGLGATLFHLLTGAPPPAAIDRATGTPLQALELAEPGEAIWLRRALTSALEVSASARCPNADLWLEQLQPSAAVPATGEVPFGAAPPLPAGRYRIALSTPAPQFPETCSCCYAAANTEYDLRIPGHCFHVPLCSFCAKHRSNVKMAGRTTFWCIAISVLLALGSLLFSSATGSLLPLFLGGLAVVLNFGALSYGGLKNSRADELLSSRCSDVSEPAACNFTGRAFVWRFKNAAFAAEFSRCNRPFVL